MSKVANTQPLTLALALADTIGYWIAGVLVMLELPGSSAPYTHAIALKNAVGTTGDAQPKSLTITDFYAANTRQYPGVQITDFGLTFNADGMPEYTVKAMGFPSVTTSAPAPSFSTVLPTQVWTGTVTIGGSSIGDVRTGNLDPARKNEAIFGIGTHKRLIRSLLGALTAKGKSTLADAR
jgi:hypothetical protein